ncbi:SMI1/KNR4 family protein [Streptomyces sp. NPDC004100]
MTTTEDHRFPAPLAAALAVRLKRIGEDDIDFEPYDSFLSAEETTDWFQAWTGNDEVTGDEFRVFGQDGSGGYVAFWLARAGRELAEQPVVFLGSEGETGVVAPDLAAFLWLLAEGYGPCEAVAPHAPDPDWTPRLDNDLAAIAERFGADRRASVAEIIAQAAQEFPDFDDTIMELCR